MSNQVNEVPCWFCGSYLGEMRYCHEWGTGVHIDCIKNVLKKNPDDFEAQTMFDELLREGVKDVKENT